MTLVLPPSLITADPVFDLRAVSQLGGQGYLWSEF